MAINSESIRLGIRNKIYLPLTKNMRKNGLNVDNFTIISNNCWGGTVYESYGMKKESPTVGMFIMPEDYVRFVDNLEEYLSADLRFIKSEKSRWKSALESKSNWGTYPIGVVGDVELHMLHYHDERQARAKWESRINRVHFDRCIYKFNDQNGATVEHLRAFDALDLANKVIFTAKAHPDIACAVKIHCPKSCDFIPASYEPFGKNRSFDVTKYINGCFS